MGFVVAAPDDRLSAEAHFPAQIDDLVAALRWLHGHAGQLGVVPSRTCVWGASAGGLLGALAPLAEAIFEHALAFLARLDAAAVALPHQGP